VAGVRWVHRHSCWNSNWGRQQIRTELKNAKERVLALRILAFRALVNAGNRKHLRAWSTWSWENKGGQYGVSVGVSETGVGYASVYFLCGLDSKIIFMCNPCPGCT